MRATTNATPDRNPTPIRNRSDHEMGGCEDVCTDGRLSQGPRPDRSCSTHKSHAQRYSTGPATLPGAHSMNASDSAHTSRYGERCLASMRLTRKSPARAGASNTHAPSANAQSAYHSCVFRTILLTFFSNASLSSRHCFAASTLAGLSSLGEEIIDSTEMRIDSTVCTGSHRSLALSYP